MTRFILTTLTIFILISCGTKKEAKSNKESETTVQTQQKVVEPTTTIQNVSGDQAQKIIMDTSVYVIDVRTPDEVKQGHIVEARYFIDLYGDFDQQIDSLDKNQSYLVYCRSGGRSNEAAQKMIDKGFTNVYNLLGGISNYTGEITE